ncbi:MAG: hypothetical protein LC808_33925 [Actinobacteria bacterium]|nr:hypothetical protein [Actinomycetota bacterium]
MTVARSVADVLADHVVFEVECIDRMYLNVYQPRLQHTAGAAAFFRHHRGHQFASSALMGPMTETFVASIHQFIDEHGLDLVHFAKGQRKDDVTQQFLAGHDGSEEVLFVGRAQEKATVTRTERRRDRATGTSYAWLVKATALVNHFYFYCVDADFGPFFLKFCSYFPYNAKLCINGHEWAKRQAAKTGIAFTALDNGFATIDSPDDVARVQEICDRLGTEDIDALLRKWLAILPHPFTPADRAADYRYHLSILQAEFSLTQMLDRPVSGRVFFEQVIRDNLDLGRPDQVGLVFARRIHTGRKQHTPGKFRTRVITNGVTPSLHVDYKHSTIKQYHKEGRALRTETTINNPGDFRIGKRLINLPALREVGFTANRRLLHVQSISHNPTAGAEAFTTVTAPVTVGTNRVAGLRFGDPRAHALLAALLVFRLHPAGFTNRDLRTHLAELLGANPDTWPAGRATYDLRRLRLHGLIERIPRSNRYRVTHIGLHHALFLTRVHDKLIRTGTAHHTDPNPPASTALRAATRAYDTALNDLTQQAGLAA